MKPKHSGKVKTEKECNRCKETKPTTDFYTDPRLKDGLMNQCKQCRNLASKTWCRNNPDKRAHHTRKAYYGLSSEDYAAMFEQQDNKCDICKVTFTNNIRVCVDHDHAHTTNKVRGLLCNDCNLLLGRAKENTDTLTNAIEYLTKHKKDTLC